MDISIDDVSWYTLSELFGNVLTAKRKHLGLSTNVKFLNQNDGSGWGQKVCLTLTLLKKNISDPFQNDEKKTSTMGFTQKQYGNSSQLSIIRLLPNHCIQTVGLSNRLQTYNSSKPHCYLYKHSILKDNQQNM